MTATRIALAGEGGQGVQSIAEILAEAAYNEQRQTIYIPNFGVEQRGGVSIAFLQFSDERIGAPKFHTADVVIALSERAVIRTGGFSDEHTLFVYDASLDLKPGDLPTQYKKLIPIPALDIASNQLAPRVFNIIIMGAVIGLTGAVRFESAKAALEYKLKSKFEGNPKLRDLNFQALEIGRDLAERSMRGEAISNG